ncbi:MAG TPA: hypothetical protein VFT43_05500, partial [Candidatus Polarisedimenticolia bacterium]|nr:hypothetical protein [Candidatus Polarisedimenticolia bacterium]
ICDTLGARPASGLKELMDDFLRTRYGHSLLERSERYAALIPGAPGDAEGAAIQGDGWALVGDAGRFVDPLTREGIFYAMLSGEILAEALAAGRPESYAATWRRSHEAEFLWAARHAGSFFAPRFLERLVALCGSSRIVARVMSDLLAGRQPYTTLKRRLILNAPRIGAEVAARRLRLSRDN